MIRRLMLSMAFFIVCVGLAFAQSKVSGVVTSATEGTPIIGATVRVVGTKVIGITDAQGRFTLNNVPTSAKSVSVSYIGMKTVTAPVAANISVKLEDDDQSLGEAIVVAYGTAKKSTFTGSAAVVPQAKLDKVQTADASKALEGLVAGVTVSSASGSPGAPTTIRIRGIGSINASSAPLVIVDGSPYEGDLNTINPADIASYTVLKDAASAALYGARGANGVVVITTKSGQEGKVAINFDAKWGYNYRGVPEYDVIRDPGTYYETMWQSIYNSAYFRGEAATLGNAAASAAAASQRLIPALGYNIYDVADNQVVLANGKLNPAAKLKFKDAGWNDWEGALFKPGLRQEYNINIASGTEKQKVYFSFGYLNDKGYNANTDFSRFTTRLKYDAKLLPWLTFSNNAQYTNSSRNSVVETSAFSNSFSWTRLMPAIYPIYKRDIDGNILKDPETGAYIYDDGGVNVQNGVVVNRGRIYGSFMNPVATQRENIDKITTDMVSNVSGVTVTLPFNFEFASNLTFSKIWYDAATFQTPIMGDALTVGGRSIKERESTQSLNFNQILRWKHSFSNGLDLTAMLGHETFKRKVSYLSGEKTGFLDYNNPELYNGTKMTDLTSHINEYALEGFFSQFTASLHDKYYVSLSLRRDASSVFHPDHRWGTFWSTGASWRVSEESFFAPFKEWVPSLKLKASYGAQGNDYLYLYNSSARSYTPYQNLYSLTSDGTSISIVPRYMGNPNITWETNYNLNVGLEFALKNNWLSGEIEFFQRRTKDLLFNLPVASSTGFSTQPTNIGNMKNTGVELTLNSQIINTHDLRVDLNLNLTHYKNVITRLPDNFKTSGITTDVRRMMEGGSIYDLYLVKWAGVNDKGESLYMLKNSATDSVYTAQTYNAAKATNSRQTIGSTLPTLQGGFGTTIEYKGVDLSVQFSYALGGKMVDFQYSSLMDPGASDRNWHTDILNSWSTTNTTSTLPRLDYKNQNQAQTSDRFVTSASYLALRNVTLGYSLPTALVQKWNLGGVRFYVVADNVALWSKRKGFDPRMSISGDKTTASYSPIRTISFGINVKL